MAVHQAPPSLGFSRQEHWSGLPFPSPMHESEKWKWSHSVVSNCSRPQGLQPTRLLRPCDYPNKSTRVGCHCLFWHASKVMFKILQARLQQYMNHELPHVQAGSRKGRGTRDQIVNIQWIIKKGREFQKNIYCASLTMPKSLTVWITTNCGKFCKRWEYHTTLPASWEICMQVRMQQLELDMEQQTGSK